MFSVLQPLAKDFYKAGHVHQYAKGTTKVYSNFTPRGTRRINPPEGVIVFGTQYYVQEKLVNQWDENFFSIPKDVVMRAYKRRMDTALGPGMNIDHIGALHDLGYLPLHVKSLPEGTWCPYRVPALTLCNTLPEFFWLTNMIETDLSMTLWKPMTSATTAFGLLTTFRKFADLTGADQAFVPWQGHDFSMRGMAGLEDSALSGAAHLAVGFTGTDTIPAIELLEQYYNANAETELIGGSVPATEHSVMCLRLKNGEFDTFRDLITKIYPKGIVSIVSDSFDFWKVLTEYLPQLKREIMARDGKVVIRPDSGDPVNIICGDPSAPAGTPANLGAIQLLWNLFGGTFTSKGFKVLDSHIGLIYGDSITPERQEAILTRLRERGFASSNVVLGVGSFTYEYVTRDTDGWAMKATYAEIDGKGVAIYKDPITDNGLKKSAKGLLRVDSFPLDNGGAIRLVEDCSWEQESGGLLKTVFKDGQTFNLTSLKEIRARVEANL
jgi:nicotinamide phosphoribosyltransferase